MNRLIILLSFGFIPFLSMAQFDYSVDFVSSIDYTHVDNTFTTFSTNVRVDPKFNFRIGGNFNVKIFENGFIKSGIRYAQVGFINKVDNLRWPSEIGPNGFEPRLNQAQLKWAGK